MTREASDIIKTATEYAVIMGFNIKRYVYGELLDCGYWPTKEHDAEIIKVKTAYEDALDNYVPDCYPDDPKIEIQY